MNRENVVLEKSKSFALRMVRMYRHLSEGKKEFVLSKQALRSGTSIGANVRESQRAQSSKDFVSKLSIAQKEADETAYWLELLHESGYLTAREFESVHPECQELIKLLASIILTSRKSTAIHHS